MIIKDSDLDCNMVSTLNGPIPPHPYYERSDSAHSKPAPRVRPEAEEYALKGQGSVGNLLQIEGLRIGSASSNRKYIKPEPKNHVQDNVRRMRQIQRETRRRQEDSAKPVKALWKSNKFEAVGSRVRDELEKEAAPPRPASANYLRAHSRTGWQPVSRTRPSTAEPRTNKTPIPKADSARDVNLVRHEIDFVRANGRAAGYTNMKRSPSLTALDDLKKRQDEREAYYQRGEVPKYLKDRQAQWQKDEEERIASIPDPEMPPGHRVLPPNEQADTLQKLKATQLELQGNLAKLPVRTDTLRMKKVKEELDRKLAEVEEAIRIFSRKKVFVREDN